MQLRVGLLNAEAKVLTARNDYLEKMNILRNYLGIREGVEILPEIPQVKIIHGVYADAIREKDRIEREEDEFNEQVRVLAEDFIAQQELVRIYREADSVAQKRYGIALNRFTVGDISVTDLNYAEQEKDEARQNYIYQLYLSWLYYYNLRYITLYDFEAGCNIAY